MTVSYPYLVHQTLSFSQVLKSPPSSPVPLIVTQILAGTKEGEVQSPTVHGQY